MSNHEHPCKHCGVDLRHVHPYDANVVHAKGKCVRRDTQVEMSFEDGKELDQLYELDGWGSG